MNARSCRAAIGLAAILLGSFAHADYPVLTAKRGDMEARLTVQAAKKTAVPGYGEVTLTLTVKGPATLEVEEPRLGDATDAWKAERSTIARVTEKDHTTWSQIIRLKQSKPGVVPVADVSVRFRDGPDGTWEEVKWVDILKHMRDGPRPPAPATEPPSWLRRWGFVVMVGLVGLLLAGVWVAKRRRSGRTPPLPTDQWALRELERIGTALLPPAADAEAFHTQVSHVVRRYLAERFGLHALQQTTAEFLEAVRQTPQLSAEQQTTLHEFFERCDLAKFARANTSPEECRRTVELARDLVRRTTASPARSASKGVPC